MDWPEKLLILAVRWMPAERGEWGRAMLAELAQLEGSFGRWQFALGCLRATLLVPRRGGLWQIMMNDKTKGTFAALRLPVFAGFLIILPFALLNLIFVIARSPRTFSLRNGLDLIVVFGVLWLGLAAIIYILTPVVRNLRRGSQVAANAGRTPGNSMRSLVENPKSAAMISFLLALPFVTLLSLLILNIEPPLGPFEPLLKNSDPDQPNVVGSLVVLGSFLLAVLACVIARAPIVQTLRSGGRLSAHPVNLILAAVILSFVAIMVIGIIIDQFPCWIGVPNCD